jgi:hypothetical protein
MILSPSKLKEGKITGQFRGPVSGEIYNLVGFVWSPTRKITPMDDWANA